MYGSDRHALAYPFHIVKCITTCLNEILKCPTSITITETVVNCFISDQGILDADEVYTYEWALNPAEVAKLLYASRLNLYMAAYNGSKKFRSPRLGCGVALDS